MPTANYSETSFASINRHGDASKLQVGEALSIANLICDGSDLVTRPGFIGKLPTVLGFPLYLIDILRTGGATQIIGAAGSKLYRFQQAGTPLGASWTTTDITPAGVTINAAYAMGVRFGKYLYVCDGLNFLIRVTDTGGAAMVSSLLAPTRTLTVGLTSTIQDPTNNASLWNGHAAPSHFNELITNGGFEIDGSGTYDASTGTYVFGAFSPTGTVATWGTVSGTPDARDTTQDGSFTPYAGTQSLLLDVYGDVLAQKIPLSALPTLNETSYGLGTSLCKTYVFSCVLHNADGTGLSNVAVTVGTRDSAGNTIGTDVSRVITEPADTMPGIWNPHRFAVSLQSIPDGVSPHHLIVMLTTGNQNQPGNSGLYVDSASLKPLDMRFYAVTADADSITANTVNSDAETATIVGLQWIRHGYGTATDLSKSDNIAVAISLPPGTLNANGDKPRFRFGYTMAGSTTIYWTNEATYSDDGNYLEVDTSTLRGKGVGGVDPRSVATGFFIQILDDFATFTSSSIFTFGPITAAGNLSVIEGVGRIYYGLFQEESYVSDTDQVLSSGSPVSAGVTTNSLMAQMTATFPASTGANAPYFENAPGTVNRLGYFRAGGTLDALYYRLVARFDPTIDQTDPKGYWSWKASTRTIIDNTPDNILTQAEYYQEYRNNWPSGIQAITANQNRLIGSNAAGVYLSWLINGELKGERGLYTSLTLSPTDPTASIKGAFDPLTSSASDPNNVQALVPHGSTVHAPRERSDSIIHNTDPLNFGVTDFLRDSGVGCVAPRTAVVVGNNLWWRSATGIVGYGINGLQGNQINRVSLRVDPLIVPDAINSGASGLTVTPAAAARSFGLTHSGRYYFGCPQPGSNFNNQLLVWDSRAPGTNGQGGWFQFTAPAFATGLTSAVSAATLVDADVAYFGGIDGQLYAHTGTLDQQTPTSQPVAIAFSYASRLYGQSPGLEWYSTNIPTELYVDALPGENMVLTQTVTGDVPASKWQVAYNLVANVAKRIKNGTLASRAKGKTLQVSFSGSTLTQFRLRGYYLTTTEGDTQ